MNQDNKEFELSGTLGSLNDTALDNLVNNTETENIVENNTIVEDNEIEMLDVAEPVSVNIDTQSNNDTLDNNSINMDLNANNEYIQPVVSQSTLDPIPTTFDVGDIGSIPPMDPLNNKENKPTKKKKGLFVFLVIILILLVGGFVYYYLHISKGALSTAVTTRDLTLQLDDNLSTDINDYATFKGTDSNNCILDTKNVNINKVGTYEYTITCGTKTYSGKITLQDTKAPEVTLKSIVKKVNDVVAPEEFVSECNETSECTYSFNNVDAVNNAMMTSGSYDIEILVTDANNNSNVVKAKLIVIDTDIKVYLNCVSNDQAIDNFDGTLANINKIGISPESQYVGIYFKTKEFTAKTEEEYNRLKNEYKNDGKISITEDSIKPVFDDENLKIIYEETISGEAEFGTNYAEIKTYFENNNEYKCNILNVN